MVVYRTARPDEREAYIQLANDVFKFQFDSFVPKVYRSGVDSASLHKVAVDEAGRLRALAAFLPETLQAGGEQLRAGIIGTVCVHPEARGDGHMKALMNSWLDEIRGRYDLAVLWGQRQRYEYFGFTRGGTMMKYRIWDANVRHALKDLAIDGLTFRPLFEIDGAEDFALRLNEGRPAYVEREEEQLPYILRTFDQQAVGVLDGEQLIGYMVIDQGGEDISELALAQPADAARTIKAYLTYLGDGKGLTITVPEYEGTLNAQLGRFAEECLIETAYMFQIFDYANVVKAYLTLKHRTMGLPSGTFSAIMDGQPVTVRADERGVTVERTALPDAVILDKQQAQTLLLTPYGRYGSVPAPAGWFPLPLFWYKADMF